MFFFNNKVLLCFWICGHIYVTDGQNKQALYIYNFCRIMLSFTKTGAESYQSILNNSKNYWLNKHPDNFKIKLYYFQERLSL